jgi:hypothetical protein
MTLSILLLSRLILVISFLCLILVLCGTFLGLRSPPCLRVFLSQEKYIQDLLDHASLTDHQTAETLMELNVHLVVTNGEPLGDHTYYHHIVGSLV